MKNRKSLLISIFVAAVIISFVVYYFAALRPVVMSEDNSVKEEPPKSFENEPEKVEELVDESSNIESKNENIAADKVVSNEQLIIDMKDPFVIKGRIYEQGEKREEQGMIGFAFNGDFKVQVNKAALYTSNEAAGIDDDRNFKELIDPDEIKNPVFLLLDLSLDNISASNPNGVQYEFNIGMLTLNTAEDFKVENYNNIDYIPQTLFQILDYSYFKDNKKNEDGSDSDYYYYFTLKEGEKLNTQLGFWIDKELFLKEELVLKLGSNASNYYGIRLNEVEDNT